MTPIALALPLLVAAAPGFEPYVDPLLGVALEVPVGWTVEALPGDAVVVRTPAPLSAALVLLPLSTPALPPRAVAWTMARRLAGQVVEETPASFGHAALVQFEEPTQPGVPWAALVAAAVRGDRTLVALLAAPWQELASARPTLEAVAQSARFSPPKVRTVAERTLVFDPLREPSVGAFSTDLPADFQKELSAQTIAGTRPYRSARAVASSPDNLHAFLHYRAASFQEPVEDLTPEESGFRPYLPGSKALDGWLFPATARLASTIADWKIDRRGGLQTIVSRRNGARLDGEEVEYSYRVRGEKMVGRAYAVTLKEPGPSSPVWFLYALVGWEAPEERGAPARTAALRLLEKFSFDGEWAREDDDLWRAARRAVLEALSHDPSQAAATPRRPRGGPFALLEQAAIGPVEVATDDGPPVPVRAGIAAFCAPGGEAPVFAWGEIAALR